MVLFAPWRTNSRRGSQRIRKMKYSELRDTLDWIERAYDVFRGCETMGKAMTKAEWSEGGHDVTLHWNRHCTKRGLITFISRVLSIRKHASIQYPSITCQ